MSKRSSVFMAVIALLSMTSCKVNPSASDSVTSSPVSEKGSEAPAKILPDFTDISIAGQKYDGTPIKTPYSGAKVTGSYKCTSDGAVTEKWYKGNEELREAPKDIGDYAYYLAVDETATYKSAFAKFPFTISALTLNFKGDFTKTYDESDKMTIDLTDENSNIIKDENVTLNITFTSAIPGSDIANMILTGDDKDNYALPEPNTIHASIVAAKVAKPWSDIADTKEFPYDGDSHSLPVEESKCYTVTGNEATEPGDYLVTASLNPGYVWSDGTTDPVTRHLVIRKTYNETMRAAVVENHIDYIIISGTESGKIFTGMQVALIDEYGKDLGTATVAEMAKLTEETEETVTEVNNDKTILTKIKLDGINLSVLANDATKKYLISIRKADSEYNWEPKVIEEPTTSSEGVAAFIANEDPNVIISVDLPALSVDDYEFKFRKTAATCTSTGVDVYCLKRNSADDAIYRFAPGLFNDEDHNYIQALQDLEFEVEVPKDSKNHTGTSHYEWSKGTGSKPTYDISKNVASTGKADKYCDACKRPIKGNIDVQYTDGMWWRKNNETYDRVYKFDRGTNHETQLIDDIGRDTWNVHVDTTDLTTTPTRAYTDATPKVTTPNLRFVIRVSKFERTGYTFDSITYYVDGVAQETVDKSMTTESSRVYYVAGATDPQFVIRIGKHENTDLGLDNNFTGDVYVKINWKKDA